MDEKATEHFDNKLIKAKIASDEDTWHTTKKQKHVHGSTQQQHWQQQRV